MLNQHSRVLVTGHRGLVGSAVVRALTAAGHRPITVSRKRVDLRNKWEVEYLFTEHSPDTVVMCAGHVGGIHANNTYPVDFLSHNAEMILNVARAAHDHNVDQLLYLGSSCIYPKKCRQPMREEDLLSGHLEPTNKPYALAKIAGIELCNAYARQYGRRYFSAMPCNLYGVNDNYNPKNSHVIPAMIRKFHTALEDRESEVVLWGTGSPRREFLCSDDLAKAILVLLGMGDADLGNTLHNGFVNIGAGTDIPIARLADEVADAVGFKGDIVWDDTKPDGTARKLMDSSRMRSTGWRPEVTLRDGLMHAAYPDYVRRYARLT